MMYSFNRFESAFFEYWSDKNLHIFSCSMHNFMNYFKFRFSQYAYLCELDRFSLRRSHVSLVLIASFTFPECDIANHNSRFPLTPVQKYFF